MSSREEQAFNEKLLELIKRITPSIFSFINPAMGLAAAILIYITWLLSEEYKKAGITNVQAHPIEVRLLTIRKEIENVERWINVMKQSLAESSPTVRKVLEEGILKLEQYRKDLEELYEFEYLKYEAWKRITKFGNEEIVKEFDKVMKKIEKGEEIGREAVKILEELKNLQVKREKIKDLMKRILESTSTT